MGDPYAAYCLDNAVGEFGRALENELKKIEGKTQKDIDVKSERLIRKWLDMPLKYRNPIPTRVGDSSGI